MATILVMNCNTSAAMTEQIRAGAEAAAQPGTKIVAAQPAWGPEVVEGFYESYLSAAAVLQRLRTWDGEPFDALVMAGFGEHGREGARQLLEVPVVDITEAAAMLACLVSHRFAVVTTTLGAEAQIEQSLAAAGLAGRCCEVRSSGLGVLAVGADPEATAEAVVRTSVGCLERGADAIVLGCSGMTAIRERVAEVLGVPVIDGVSAAVTLCEGLTALGLRTSGRGPYAPLSARGARTEPAWAGPQTPLLARGHTPHDEREGL